MPRPNWPADDPTLYVEFDGRDVWVQLPLELTGQMEQMLALFDSLPPAARVALRTCQNRRCTGRTAA
ncbi:MAG: hypothetical protein JOZ62_13190 [Acidobacteriaceae bacterium]|nr:hypothetical protein [Acidobacteriaceae bacterium]